LHDPNKKLMLRASSSKLPPEASTAPVGEEGTVSFSHRLFEVTVWEENETSWWDFHVLSFVRQVSPTGEYNNRGTTI
jgi:hypothetical protein